MSAALRKELVVSAKISMSKEILFDKIVTRKF